MNAPPKLHSRRPLGKLLGVIIAIGCFAVGMLVQSRTGSWLLTLVYALVVAEGALEILRSGPLRLRTESETASGRDERLAGISLLAAVAVQFSLKFYFGFSWIWSIVIAVAAGLVIALFSQALKVGRASLLKADFTWVFGNLPPLEMKRRRRSDWTPSSRSAGAGSHRLRGELIVHINGQAFSLSDEFEVDKLLPANLEKCGSVDLVRARALPNQVVVVARRCVVRSFGGEFTAVTLLKENTPPSMKSVTGAFLYFGKASPLEPLRLERIAVVVAGGEHMLRTITRQFSKLASEMLGESLNGSRGQRMWDAGDLFLVLEKEAWEDLRRATITWTCEDLDVGGTR